MQMQFDLILLNYYIKVLHRPKECGECLGRHELRVSNWRMTRDQLLADTMDKARFQ